MNQQATNIFWGLALLGAALGVVADICLLHSASAVYENMDYRFLLDISPNSLLWGHYLGIFAIPLEGLGLWLLIQGLWAEKWLLKGVLMFFVAWILLIGVVYHAAITWLAAWLREGHSIELVRHFFEPLGTALAVLFLGLAVPFSVLVWRKKSLYTRALLWGNPLFLYPICILLYIFWPAIGRYTAVAGFNLSIFLLFIALRFQKSVFPK
jgi:hypothetical protein